MPPKAAEPSTKKFAFLEVAKMVFSIKNNFPEPTQEEIEYIKWLVKNNPDELDSRELWVLENLPEGDEDD
jgi:hypothetical protein